MKLRISHLPILAAASFAATVGSVAPPAENCAWMYGINDNSDIIEYNPILQSAGVVKPTGLAGVGAGGNSNSFAFDTQLSRMFFIYTGNFPSSVTGLYFWDQQANGPVTRIASLSTLLITNGVNPSNAAFANGNFYFIRDQNAQLVTCSITPSMTTPTASCTFKTINLAGTGLVAGDFQFGDVAVNNAGILYGGTATSPSIFFSLNVNQPSPALVVIKSKTQTPTNPSLQLAFDATYSTLYATEFQNGKWYTVNTGTGNLIQIPGFLTPNSAPNFFGARDLGGSSCRSSANSDPHLVGATGERYDFDGEPGNIYSLFSAPQFQIAMHLAGDGPGTHFMTQIGMLFKGEEFFFDQTTMTEAFRADLEARLTRVGGTLLDWSSYHAKLALCPGHTVSITQMHTTDSSLLRADGSPYNYYDVEIVSPGCHDAYDGALGQTYKCKYADGEPFVWSHGQEEFFRLPTLFTPSGSYSVEAACDDESAGNSLSGVSGHHQRRGLASGAGKLAVQTNTIDSSIEESHDKHLSQPLRRYRKRTDPRATEARMVN